VQGAVHDRPGDRVEEQVTDPRAPERPRQVHVTAGAHVTGVLLGAVAVGQLRPVGGDAGEVVEPQRARLVDEQPLVARVGLDGARRARRGQARHVRRLDVAGGPRRVGARHVAHATRQPHPPSRSGVRHVRAVRQP
jgi:hypothetical protein